MTVKDFGKLSALFLGSLAVIVIGWIFLAWIGLVLYPWDLGAQQQAIKNSNGNADTQATRLIQDYKSYQKLEQDIARVQGNESIISADHASETAILNDMSQGWGEMTVQQQNDFKASNLNIYQFMVEKGAITPSATPTGMNSYSMAA